MGYVMRVFLLDHDDPIEGIGCANVCNFAVRIEAKDGTYKIPWTNISKVQESAQEVPTTEVEDPIEDLVRKYLDPEVGKKQGETDDPTDSAGSLNIN